MATVSVFTEEQRPPQQAPAEPVKAQVTTEDKAQVTTPVEETGSHVDPNGGAVEAREKDGNTPSAGRGRLQVPLDNGDDVLALTLPEKLSLVQLIDLVGEYLRLDCVYDAEKIGNQTVTLKLHSKAQSEICVRDLYCLLETVLKFKGLAMTRQEGDVVTIVPAAEALEADPELVDPNTRSVRAGDMVVTRAFQLQHVDASSVTTLLQAMKLGVAVSGVAENQTLFVTCYAHRMGRIAQLVEMVDKPGKPREFRFRQLKHTAATTLAQKILALAQELGNIPVIVASPAKETPEATARIVRRLKSAVEPEQASAPTEQGVYLDADDRTNRVLMVGSRDQLRAVEELIDALDIPGQNLRIVRVYGVEHVEAVDVMEKLTRLKLVAAQDAPVERPAAALPPNPNLNPPAVLPARAPAVESEALPQAVVLEAANSLLVRATQDQHAGIEATIRQIDVEPRKEAIPYEIYFLENQDPTELAEVLGMLVQETVKDKDGKVEKVIPRTEEQITIVPDKTTYSLIVYASRKNQQWIAEMVKQLDMRRPQVLIDCTLVEVTKSDAFNYDLNVLRSSPDITSTSSITGAEPNGLGKFLQWGGGGLAAFYGDNEVQALLRTMQSKNYGRVLAKPKLLVNDNEQGKIETKDTTYVEVTSSIPVSSGAAGNQTSLVQTSVNYSPYEAGISLDITPHISEGDLLRLDVMLTRSDFLKSVATRPPNTRSNTVDTAVTLPNGSTVILGGLMKMNQNKGGSKVPILGDIPIIGGLFRSINNEDTQSKLYVFVKAEIIRPAGILQGMEELKAISETNRRAFEKHEREFQTYQDWPGIKPRPVEPAKVLEAR
ncbi:MAG: hypothetical protein A2Y76_10585 [Planctomycetes bacterium RBG_13_60_9]|nr:MAG: hypothetical protein A2Y76_10585 [Planctomycetes bacterium RBG_13_60_9]